MPPFDKPESSAKALLLRLKRIDMEAKCIIKGLFVRKIEHYFHIKDKEACNLFNPMLYFFSDLTEASLLYDVKSPLITEELKP
jgi:hypothetical protein